MYSNHNYIPILSVLPASHFSSLAIIFRLFSLGSHQSGFSPPLYNRDHNSVPLFNFYF